MTRHSGFLLLEVAVVGAILALMVGISWPLADELNRIAVRTEVAQLCVALQQLQHRALTTGVEQQLIFDERGYGTKELHHTLNPRVYFGAATDAKGPPTQPRAPISTAITFAHKKISCTKYGILSAGTIYLTDQEHQISYAVSVPVGGYYHTQYRWNGMAWESH